MKSNELKTKIYFHAHSLILTLPLTAAHALTHSLCLSVQSTRGAGVVKSGPFVAGTMHTVGSPVGQDQANGNLLGTGEAMNQTELELCQVRMPTRDTKFKSVNCSTYSAVSQCCHRVLQSCGCVRQVAVSEDNQAWTWGDCDGGSLGRYAELCLCPYL